MGLRLQQQFHGALARSHYVRFGGKLHPVAVPTIPGYADHGVNCGCRNQRLHTAYGLMANRPL
jgi:hypothetical protein